MYFDLCKCFLRFLNVKKIRISYSGDGLYIKTACTINIKADYQDAERICRQLNMELISITSYATLTELDYVLKHKFPGGTSWVNGRMNSDGVWAAWALKSLSSPLDTTLLLDVTAAADTNCLTFKDQSGAYKGVSKACNQKVERFTCEFTKQPILQTDSCWKTLDLMDPITGAKAKTACTVGTLENYYEAEQFCLKKGMVLLDGFYDYDAGYFPTDVWINGLTFGTSKWYAYIPKEHDVDMSKPTDWAVGGQTAGECLSLTEESAGNWVGKGANCDTPRTYFVCQYDVV